MPFGTSRAQGFNSAPVSVFEAGDTIINRFGMFTYSGTPGAGNLVSSVGVKAAGTDKYGNAYLPGNTTYTITTGVGFAHQETAAGTNTLYSLAGLSGPWAPGGTSIVNGNWIIIFPSGDTTGNIDTLNLLLGAEYQLISLAPGKFYINATIPLAKNSWVMGSGLATEIIPVGNGLSWMFSFTSLECGIQNFQVYGGTNTPSDNPTCGLVEILSGAIRCSVLDIDMNYMNGGIMAVAPTGPMHLRIRGVRGTDNGGGISVGASAGTSAQISIEDVDLQSCQAFPALTLINVQDVAVSKMNAAVSFNGNCVQVFGACESVFMSEMDCAGGGTGSGEPVLQIDVYGALDPAEISIANSVFQQGGVGIAVNGGSSRLRFSSVLSKGNGSDNWQWNGTGAFNVMDACGGNTGNALGGVGYDVNVTGTAHVCNDKFQYVSGAVTAGRFLAAGNHYTESNPVGTITVAGAAPGGW
jgi:hypothetical protein